MTIDLRGMAVSEGTMRPKDLIPEFAELLKSQTPDGYEAWRKEYPEIAEMDTAELKEFRDLGGNSHWVECEEVYSEALDYLFDALDKIAPDGYYFGAHEGDGACYGFWEVDNV